MIDVVFISDRYSVIKSHSKDFDFKVFVSYVIDPHELFDDCSDVDVVITNYLQIGREIRDYLGYKRVVNTEV